MAHSRLRVPSIACEGCARSIKQALGRLPGVQKVEVDVAGKNVDVDYDAGQVAEENIKERIESADYAVEGVGHST